MSAMPDDGDGHGPLIAANPLCGTAARSIEAPVLIRSDGPISPMWAEVCDCPCGAVFVPPETEQLLREVGGEREPPEERNTEERSG